VELVGKSWADAAERFFGEGGVYDNLAPRLP
jgi:hypothetical protein